MRALRLLFSLASTHAFPWKRHTSAAAIHRRKRRFVRGGAWGFGKNKDSAAEADNATTTDGEGMSQSQIDEALSVVPVFCLADPEGRPVLMTAPEDKDDARLRKWRGRLWRARVWRAATHFRRSATDFRRPARNPRHREYITYFDRFRLWLRRASPRH